jgi:hypothetical protein
VSSLIFFVFDLVEVIVRLVPCILFYVTFLLTLRFFCGRFFLMDRPKGVMTSFRAMTECTQGVCELLKVTENDRYLSYLPVAHGMERWLGEVRREQLFTVWSNKNGNSLFVFSHFSCFVHILVK